MFVDPSHGNLKAGAGPLASGEHHVPAMLFTQKGTKQRAFLERERERRRETAIERERRNAIASDQCHAVD